MNALNLLTSFLRQLPFIALIILNTITALGQNQIKSFAVGAYIIDMGQNTTINAGLKPYGLVYALIQAKVPVYWSINSAKSKDGSDFTLPVNAGGKIYSGGPFIISAEDASSITGVSTLISTWRTKGAVIDGPISAPFEAPVFNVITSWPRAILDTQNDNLITPYYTNAEVPSASYVTEGDPTELTSCGDIYVLPHADPQNWPMSYVRALKSYIDIGGFLWVGCHAVSALDLGWPSTGITISKASPAKVSWTAHGFVAGDQVKFYSSGTLPSPLVAGTTYYVISEGLNANVFEISGTSGGAAINTSVAGSGAITSVPGFNFLTTNGLEPWTNLNYNGVNYTGHNNPAATDVYTYNPVTAADPVMQFMGRMDASLHNGSEEIYLPRSGSSWRGTTTVAVYDNNYADSKTDVTYVFPANPAVLVA